MILNFLLFAIIYITPIKACRSPCNSTEGCTENILPIYRTIGINHKYVCHRLDTCFGLNDTSSIPVQQFPVNLLYGQSLVLNISSIANYTFQIIHVISYQHFTTCNQTNATEFYHNDKVKEGSVTLHNLTVGRHFILFVTDHNLYTCQLGFRLQIDVFNQTCFFNNQTVCSNNSQCILQNDTYQCQCCQDFYGPNCDELDGCSNHECLNNATCIDVRDGPLNDTYSCRCLQQFTGEYCELCQSGFTGLNCSQDINECVMNDSICNRGNCTNLHGSFDCTCALNVTGRYCETDLYDACLSNPCSTNATCVDTFDGFYCLCHYGFTGHNCEVEVNECSNHSCSLEGTSECLATIGGYLCNCIPGYTGRYCKTDIDECSSAPCLNGALCVNLINDFQCACQPGFDGKQCENIANKCEVLKPCQNNATCLRSGDNLRNYTCHCLPGLTGRNCSSEINECLAYKQGILISHLINPCRNNGTCIDLFNNFTCNCTAGWTGRICETNIDMCLTLPCKNNATCVDSSVGLDYSCSCPAGFTSKNCEVNIDDCAIHNVSCNHGNCSDLIESFVCKCDQGWFGKYCDTDRDLCSSKPCVHANSCENVNTSRGFRCHCKDGYMGEYCITNIDDCVNHTCQNGGQCVDLINNYNCSCPPGFYGRFCENNTNECSSNPCLNNATCKDFINQYFCECKQGFSGQQCEHNIDDCLSSPCKNGATCQDLINNFTCQCLPGFEGHTCDSHMCDTSNVCHNNGICSRLDGGDGFQCTCSKYFTGKNCENSINECIDQPCQHNSSCVDLREGFRCDCVFPYSGDLCEDHLCDRNVCHNGATCVAFPKDYLCQCKAGFTSRNCEDEIDECLQNKCNVTGTLQCQDLLNNYSCICNTNYIGRFCETHLCDIPTTCNNGTCVANTNGYNCMCNPGFTGRSCDVNVNECQNISCGTGSCIDEINNYTCTCPHLRAGRHCEIDLNFCSLQPCLHNKSCTNDVINSTYHCDCGHIYSGKNCENHICNVSNPCNNGTCVSMDNDFQCLCVPGFTGRLCKADIDECLNDPCMNGATCLNEFNNYTCICPRNFTGLNCETFVSFCNTSTCMNNGSCKNNYTSMTFQCDCLSTFSGERCEFHECDIRNPCQNNATCLRTPHAPSCLCQPGFTSHDCSIEINECASQPCLNGGNCTDIVNGYECLCSRNFTGVNCEDYFSYCNHSVVAKTELTTPCLNGGICFDDYDNQTFKCQCPAYFSGKQCEVELDSPCKPNPCLHDSNCDIINNSTYNCSCGFAFEGQHCEVFKCPCRNGRCIRKSADSSYSCLCKNGYTGKYCKNVIGDCRNITHDNLKCSHEDFCKNTSNGFRCVCPSHLQGKQCDIAGGCRPTTCKNNATCVGQANYNCICPQGFTGQFCEHDINECIGKPCLHGDCAEDGIDSFECYCYKGFNGSRCEQSISTVLMSSSAVRTIMPTSTLRISLSTSSGIRSTLLNSSVEKTSLSTNSGITSSLSTFSNNQSIFSTFNSIQTSFSTSIGTSTFSHQVISSTSVHNTSTQQNSLATSFSTPATSFSLTTKFSITQSSSSSLSTSQSCLTNCKSIIIPSLSFTVKSGFHTGTTFNSVLPTSLQHFTTIATTQTIKSSSSSNVMNTTRPRSNTISLQNKTSSMFIRSTSDSTSSSVLITSSNASAPSTTTTTHLSVTTLSPTVATTHLPVTTLSPTVTATQPLVATLSSTATSTHLTVTLSPSATATQPPVTTVSPASTTLQPPVTTLRPFINLTCNDNPCNGYTCINETDNDHLFRCVCPFRTIGPTCVLGARIHYPRFNGFSFIALPHININKTINTIVLNFHTSSPHGVLLYANNSQSQDFIKLYVENGLLMLSFNTGANTHFLNSGTPVNTGDDMLVSITLESSVSMVTLSINDIKVTKHLSSSFRMINVNSLWYLGGLPETEIQQFVGCIKKFQVNDKPYSLTDVNTVSNWLSISDCDVSACDRGACSNNATCVRNIYDVDDYQCQCRPGFYGPNCDDTTNHCMNDPCNGQGKCVSTFSGYRCLCYYGKLGAHCLIDDVISLPEFSTLNNHSSYIEYAANRIAPKALERFEVRLQFRVKDVDAVEDSVLLYIGQSTIGAPSDDLFTVGIHQGHIVLIFNLGDGLVTITSDQSISSSRTWNFIVAGRTRQHGYLYFNSQDKQTASSSGLLSGLNVNTPLYIGGVPDFTRLPSVLNNYFRSGFNGIIHDVALRTDGFGFVPLLTLTVDQVSANMIGIPVEQGLNVKNVGEDQCVYNPCANNGTCITSGLGFTCRCVPPYKGRFCEDRVLSCIEYNPCHTSATCRSDWAMMTCDCPMGRAGEFCTKTVEFSTPYFKTHSFMALQPRKIRSSLQLSMRFKSDAENGLLFFTSHSLYSTQGDFFAISVWKRYIYVRFNLGSHLYSMRSRNKIQLYTWHSFYLRWAGKQAIMRLDRHTYVGVKGSGRMTKLDVGTMFYLGGVPDNAYINSGAVKDVSLQKDFVGCIEGLSVNGYTYRLDSSNINSYGRNIVDCGGACSRSACLNNADCEHTTNNTYQCKCPLGHVGDRCQQATDTLTNAFFTNSSYWFTRASLASLSTSSFFEISFKSSTNGLMIWFGRLRDVNSDFLSVGFHNGNLRLTLKMAGKEASAEIDENLLNDRFHKLRIERVASTVTFFVNGHQPRLIALASTMSTMNNDGYLYVGGLPGNIYELTNGLYETQFNGCLTNLTYTGIMGEVVNFASKNNAMGINVKACGLP